nr:capsid protein [Cressdnaviricota sp.]
MKKFQATYPRTYKAIKYGGKALQVANQAYNMAKVVASIVNSEKKYFDTALSIAPDSATANITCLTNMAQGDTNITRNGNTIALKSLELRGQIFQPVVETNRIMLVRDNDNLGGSAPTITDILESNSVAALRNKNTPKRFTVLYDKTISGTNNMIMNKKIKYYKKFKMMKDSKGNPTRSVKLMFDGPNAADYTRGHIFLVVMGDVATASTTSTLTANARIRFYDN